MGGRIFMKTKRTRSSISVSCCRVPFMRSKSLRRLYDQRNEKKSQVRSIFAPNKSPPAGNFFPIDGRFRNWHDHDVTDGLRVKNGAVHAVSCAWIWNRDFPIKCPDSVHSTFKFDWNRTWMFQLLEFCDTISYCDLIIYSEFRMIKSCTIKDMREEHVILG